MLPFWYDLNITIDIIILTIDIDAVILYNIGHIDIPE